MTGTQHPTKETSHPPENPAGRVLQPPRPLWLLALFGLALAVRGAMLYLHYRQYLAIQAYGGNAILALGGSDVPGWLGIAAHFGRSLNLSYWLLAARPPGFPAVAALASWLTGGGWTGAAILQIIFGALTALLGYLLARRVLIASALPHPEAAAKAAGLILALDPASVNSSATLMSEPLFNLLFTACVLFIVLYIARRRWVFVAGAALTMGLAMLTRPTAIYFWLVAPLILIPFIPRWWKPALALAGAGLAVYLGWSARNLYYEGVFTFSTQANFSLLFLRGISAEHLTTGRPVDDLYVEYVQTLYRRTGNDAAARTVEPDDFWNFLVAPSPELYHAMGTLAREKLIRYAPVVVLSTPIGAWRMFAITKVFPRWFVPIELVYHLLLYGFTLIGAWLAFRRRDWLPLCVAGVPILYVTGLTFVSQISAMDTRMRTPITAFIALLAVYGVLSVREMWQQRRATA